MAAASVVQPHSLLEMPRLDLCGLMSVRFTGSRNVPMLPVTGPRPAEG